MTVLTLEEATRWLTGLSVEARRKIESAIDVEYSRLSGLRNPSFSANSPELIDEAA